jgi:uncharacterized protein with NRDE domain
MCLVALALGQSDRFPLILASNRDEFFDRAAALLGWWSPAPGAPELLGGRDLQAGGTWLALAPTGRMALVTNVRGGDPGPIDAPSRGGLVPAWLSAEHAFEPHWARIEAAGYHGFNLIAGDAARGEWFWAGSDVAGPRRLTPGLYGLSNAALDTPWPKVQRLKLALRQALATSANDPVDRLAGQLFAALGDPRCADDAELPATGVPLVLERQLSAAFIRTPDGRYGTRCSTLVVTEITAQGPQTHVIEHSFGPGIQPAVERRTQLAPWPQPTQPTDGAKRGQAPIVERVLAS